MGASAYLKGLEPLFKTQANLPLTMKKPKSPNNGKLASETLLADTAYGQGQLLLSPIEQAAMYKGHCQCRHHATANLDSSCKGKRTSVLQSNAAKRSKPPLTHVVSGSKSGTAHDLAIDGHTSPPKPARPNSSRNRTQTARKMVLVVMDADKNTYLTVALIEGTGSGDVVTATKPFVELVWY